MTLEKWVNIHIKTIFCNPVTGEGDKKFKLICTVFNTSE